MFWPTNMAIFYPHPGTTLAISKIIPAALLLASITAAAIWKAKKLPFFIVGWLWYLGTLIPVIGLVQLWEQARADRYTYIPSIGFFIIIAWSISKLTNKSRHKNDATASIYADAGNFERGRGTSQATTQESARQGKSIVSNPQIW